MVGLTAPIAAFVAKKAAGGRTRTAKRKAKAAEAKRRMAEADYFGSRCKAASPQVPIALARWGLKIGRDGK